MTRAVVILIALGLAAGASGQEQQSATPSAAVLPSYRNNEKGLRKLFEDILEAAERNDQQRLVLYSEMLVPTGLAPWFVSVFGEDMGQGIAQAYETSRETLQASLRDGFNQMAREHLTEVRVFRIDHPCRVVMDEQKYAVAAAREHPETFYEVLVASADGKRAVSVWFLAFAEKNFRYLGKIRFPQGPATPETTESEEPPKRIPIGGDVQQIRIIEQARPRYPDVAKRRGIQGTVKLEAVIGKDGRVRDLKLISGRCLLVEAAVNAVRQWRYQPTLLNGEPVEVLTTIDVIFTLSR